ncbi:MAG: hypothetical protein AUK47_27080 [Deltaproteobacteria bacterium CG2_30_63_29]|nr:MAG: hypothetical protein AUK47_27080 [Deltaproteobacteria bacterium CG2_30_63_29]PJB34197.1 MAG: hypothetical protein CO108_28980 [Deltaproteobacteria bacterium CG_4_9_14_3_um_filter_63_12]
MNARTQPDDSWILGRILSAMAIGLALGGCTDTNLYSPTLARQEANRIALTGEVCTEDPVTASFPVRVVLLVDVSSGPLFSDFDPGGTRIEILRNFIQSALNDSETEIAIVTYSGRARKLAPSEGNFTRNPGELLNAINAISLAEPCLGIDQCRDYREGLRTSGALIEGDMASLPAGLRVLTQYVVVMVNAGPQQPTALESDCCQEDDIECINNNQNPSLGCEALLGPTQVTQLRDMVTDGGGAGLRLHIVHLGADPDVNVNQQVQDVMEGMAFAGGGVYQRYDAAGGLSDAVFDVLSLRTLLTAKLIFAANLNAIPGPDGPQLDSDADGLSDEEEERWGTSAGNRDTDGDGITDLVEVLTGFDPLLIDLPTACATIIPYLDADLDGLTDCDESLLGTEPTLVDGDGDGMPDILEVTTSTDYLNKDTEADTDSDGVSNGDELRQHSDPRSTDSRAHLTYGYRYEFEDEGILRQLVASKLIQITGVDVKAINQGTTPGVGTMSYDAGAKALQWLDANDGATPGPWVKVGAGGTFELPSSSYAAIQGDDGRMIEVDVNVADLPSASQSESLRVVYRDRQCIKYMIRNVQLMGTRELDDGTRAGSNSVIVYFAQAPDGKLDVPGPFRMAQVPIIFNPPAAREPADAILLIKDDEFVRPQITAVTYAAP